MAKQKYALNSGEKIVYKTSCVRHGFWLIVIPVICLKIRQQDSLDSSV